MRRIPGSWFARVAFAALLFGIPGVGNALAQSTATLYAVTASNTLLTVNAATPGTVQSRVPITNLATGDTIVGIDVRPANRLLYALGSTGQLYILNPVSGAAIRIAAPFTGLQGTSFGFDFNPTVDAIRVVSNTGQNLRVNPDTAVVTTDLALNYAAGDPNAGVPQVGAAGYLNPDTNPATGTTLFDIDARPNIGVTQAPPNDGRLTTFGPLGFDTTEVVSLDFDATNTAFVAAQRPGETTSVLFQTGPAGTGIVGQIGAASDGLIVGLAVSLGTPATPAAGIVYATTGTDLLTFNADTPGTIQGPVPIANLATGEQLVGLDFRPANNLLYALGRTGQLYIIDAFTARASRVAVPLTTALSGTEFGFDFNPVPDAIRIVSNTGQNLRVNPNTAAVTVDIPVAYAPGDANAGRTPAVVGAAYTNPDTDPATGTTLFVVDAAQDLAATQDPPNNGTLNTFFRFGVDVPTTLSVDIGRTRALIAVSPSGLGTSFLYDVTGAPRLLGAIGTNVSGVRNIAISLGR